MNEADIFKYAVKPWSDEELLLALAEAFRRFGDQKVTERYARAGLEVKGLMTAEEKKKHRLEALEPGITKVRWDTDSSVLVDDV